MKIVIVDYGMGNIYSLKSATRYLGVESILSAKAEEILTTDRLILPGVGSFNLAMQNLRKTGLEGIIQEAALEKKIPTLGVCLGMQLMGASSPEDGFTEGLNLVPFPVIRFEVDTQKFKVPHVGFNTVTVCSDSLLFRGMPKTADFYFVHSYRMTYKEHAAVSSTCFHGETFTASFQHDNICGTQFHPEKSQSNGLYVLKNFLEWQV